MDFSGVSYDTITVRQTQHPQEGTRMTREEKIAWAKAATEQELLQEYNSNIEAAARCPLLSEESLAYKANARIVEEELLARIAAWKEAQG